MRQLSRCFWNAIWPLAPVAGVKSYTGWQHHSRSVCRALTDYVHRHDRMCVLAFVSAAQLSTASSLATVLIGWLLALCLSRHNKQKLANILEWLSTNNNHSGHEIKRGIIGNVTVFFYFYAITICIQSRQCIFSYENPLPCQMDYYHYVKNLK